MMVNSKIMYGVSLQCSAGIVVTRVDKMVCALSNSSTMDREISECGVASMALASTCDKIAIDWNG